MYPKPALLLLICFMSLECFCIPSFCASGNNDFPKDFSAGLVSSPKGVGLCMDLWYDGETFTSLSFTSDLIDILNGESSTPGGKSTIHYNFIFDRFKDGRIDLYAGPGLAAGYVRNTTDNKYGIMAGVSCDAGLRIKCLHSIVLSFELQADFALIFKNRRNPDMALYKAGFLNSYYPHVRIQYAF